MILKRANMVGMAVLVLIAACGDASPPPEGARPLVIASTSVIGDLVNHVVGGHADVEILIPRATDPHDFQPSSRQVARIHDADLVVASGLGLEEGLEDVLDAAAGEGVEVVSLGDFVETIPLHGSSDPDPHFWMDPMLIADSLGGLVDALSSIGSDSQWAAAAATLQAELAELDTSLMEIVSEIPVGHRKLVTTHDSLGYFATAYGFDVVAVAVPGGSTLGSPSAADLDALISVIEAEEIPAMFVDSSSLKAIADAISGSTDVAIVPISVATLGDPGTPTATYFGMMLHLGETLREALR